MSQASLYNPKCETMPREELGQLQFERLQSTLNRVYRNVAFYRAAFDAHRINLEKIRDVRSLAELPFTTKDDLRKSYPYDMFAVPLKDIVRIHSTSGTTGKPVVVGYTRNDLKAWTECTARVLAAADRGYVLETGQIVLEGTSGELSDNPEVQRAYLGKEYRRIDEEER